MRLVTVIPVGPGRLENLAVVLDSLRLQSRPLDGLVVVEDGPDVGAATAGITTWPDCPRVVVGLPKHVPGREQPRNFGVRVARQLWADVTHVHFVDSDVVLAQHAVAALEGAVMIDSTPRIVVGPYDWLPPGLRPNPRDAEAMLAAAHITNDPRWEMFLQSPAHRSYESDLSAGLACFSGNLLWPVGEFERVGGFWNEINHGRCEDGELGLRAVTMGVPIGFQAAARGFHLWHPINTHLAIERNKRDVPMLNDRHPWVEQGAVFMVDRDGKAFDVTCGECGEQVPTIGWWGHASTCGTMELPVA